LLFLWAIINSPVSNAFIYLTTSKRDIQVNGYKSIPVPDVQPSQTAATEFAAKAYLDFMQRGFANNSKSVEIARHLLMKIDAEVLKLYTLSPRDERTLLDMFNAPDVERRVPFSFGQYFPDGFKPYIHLYEYIDDESNLATAEIWRSAVKDQNAPPHVLKALKAARGAFNE
jgi:hypothetical protein